MDNSGFVVEETNNLSSVPNSHLWMTSNSQRRKSANTLKKIQTTHLTVTRSLSSPSTPENCHSAITTSNMPHKMSHDRIRDIPPVRIEERAPNSSIIRMNSDCGKITPVSLDSLDLLKYGEDSVKDNHSMRLAVGLGVPCPTSFMKNMDDRKEQMKNEKQIPRSVRSYYQKMDDILDVYSTEMNKNDLERNGEKISDETGDITTALTPVKLSDRAEFLAKISFFTNLALLILKAVAAALSGSLSVISSLVDSVMDLVSGVIIWLTSSAMKKKLPYHYPSGRTRLEPVAIVILSAIMSVASVQLVAESIQAIISIAKKTAADINFDYVTMGVLAATILAKAVLWLLCRDSASRSVQALSLDHRNDILANMVAAVCGYVGDKYWPYLDKIGAIIISVYIMYNWWKTGAEQIKFLTGYTADPGFLSKVTWISIQHDMRIRQIDTVRAYHFGNNYIVEVHIVLPEDMSLKEAHDIGEPLQMKLESIEQVERAFVHIDYESEHDPETEHRVN